MKALFVHYVHPDTPHVSSMRIKYFAEALAKKGHQIVLLTATKNDNDQVKSPERVEKELASHDWTKFYHLACPSLKINSLDAARNGNLLVPIRKLVVAWHFLFHDGVFCDWTKGSLPYWPVIIRAFKPNVTLGVFGNSDSLAIARGIAKMGGGPWVIDMKDNWKRSIPGILRSILARRFRDATAVTTNSLFFGDVSKEWFPHNPVTIYSGVSPTVIKKRAFKKNHKFRIMLIGSLYNKSNLNIFIEGIFRWLENLSSSERNSVIFTYAGTNFEAVQKVTNKLKTRCELEINPYLNAKDYFQLCVNSSVNCFLWSPTGFHHKLIELFFCRRPIIIFPGLSEEEKMLANKTKAKLFHSTNIEELINSFQELWLSRNESIEFCDPKELARYTWESQSEKFEKILDCSFISDSDQKIKSNY
jgi:hypothetical protein